MTARARRCLVTVAILLSGAYAQSAESADRNHAPADGTTIDEGPSAADAAAFPTRASAPVT